MAYVLDANVFIEAKNRFYGFDFCPAFWDWIDQAHAAGKVFSIEKVADEIVGGDDDLAAWAQQRDATFFLRPDAAVVASLQATSAWASTGNYEPRRCRDVPPGRHYYLVAHAHAHGHIVVTHEVITHSTKKIKIPNACIALGMKCMTPFEMLRVERARFVLDR